MNNPEQNTENNDILCPQTGNYCYRTPQCALSEATGKTMCAEWVLKQREEGKREHEANAQSTSTHRK